MKRYVIAIIVLAVILSVILVNVSLMDTIAADFGERLEAIETLVRADDWEGAKAGMEAFAEDWDKKKTYLMAVPSTRSTCPWNGCRGIWNTTTSRRL